MKVDFDYGIYNKHRIKIQKDRNSLETVPDMGETLDDRKLKEMQIFDDIQEVYDTVIIDNVEFLGKNIPPLVPIMRFGWRPSGSMLEVLRTLEPLDFEVTETKKVTAIREI